MLEAYKQMQKLYDEGKIRVINWGIFGATSFETVDGLVKANLEYSSMYKGWPMKLWHVFNNGSEVFTTLDGVEGTAKVFNYFIEHINQNCS